MARHMTGVSVAFGASVDKILGVAEAGEITASTIGTSNFRKVWPLTRVELLYEIAYLRMFIEWELYLETVSYRYMCGFSSSAGIPVPLPGSGFFPSIRAAEASVLSGRSYVLWHNPEAVVKRVRKYIASAPVETVVASQRARLEDLAAIRHRIAHGQSDAKHKFDQASMNLAGRRYKGARPGRFLRDWHASSHTPTRWLSATAEELKALAIQIA